MITIKTYYNIGFCIVVLLCVTKLLYANVLKILFYHRFLVSVIVAIMKGYVFNDGLLSNIQLYYIHSSIVLYLYENILVVLLEGRAIASYNYPRLGGRVFARIAIVTI